MTFRKATVTGTKALCCLYAESGGGKTYSGLLLARGLVGPSGKIAMIDTENRRGELYADDPAIGGYDVAQLEAPFTPQRYIDMIDAAEAAGYDAIVIDSGSHEWEGEGGVLDMAVDIAKGGQPKFGDWKVPKTQHKHLIQRLQRCKAHVVICLRAHYKSRQIERKDYAKHGITSGANSTIIRDEYQSPIQDERFIFEVTVHLQMSNQHPGVPIVTKCPVMLLAAFPEGEQISVETGRRMADFYDRGTPATSAEDRLFEEARKIAAGGTDSYAKWFGNLPASSKRELVNSGQHDQNKATAALVGARLQDPPAEPDDDGRPDYGNDDPPLPEVEPNFDGLGQDGGSFDD
jgi:hypothetical protein